MQALHAIARAVGRSSDIDDPAMPKIGHLRRVDDRLLAGAQPSKEDFEALAKHGVKLIIDLRTGTPDDSSRDDPEHLTTLGMDYVSLPIPDGHAPPPGVVDRFMKVMADANGLAFLHCGAGVGRSTSMQAAYQARSGGKRPLLDYLTVGPPTIEQVWFMHNVSGDGTAPRNQFVEIASRALDAPRRTWSRLKHQA